MTWTPIKDEIAWPDIGSQLLDNLAKGIYSSQAVLREYVQNARDAYQRLDDPPDNPVISIRLFPAERLLTITDQGSGMDLEGIRAAKRIAVSAKPLQEEMAGFRGIGIWAGYEACEKLVVKSTATGDPHLYQLTIDFAAIRHAIDTQKNIKEVIDPNYQIEEEDTPREHHFTQVSLYGIYDPGLLTRDDLVRIASTVFPCRIDPSFEFSDEVRRILNGFAGYQEYAIKIQSPEGEMEAFRSFPGGTEGPRTQIFRDMDGKELARAWWCATTAKQLKEEKAPHVKRRGFQLRESNIAVGDINAYSGEHGLQWGIRKHSELPASLKLEWFCGEIHVTNPAIRPNTPRDALEQSQDSRELIGEMRGFFHERLHEARGRSDFNTCRKALQRAQEFARNHRGEVISEGTDLSTMRSDHIAALRALADRRKGQVSNESKRILVQLLREDRFETARKTTLVDLEALVVIQPSAEAPTGRNDSADEGSGGADHGSRASGETDSCEVDRGGDTDGGASTAGSSVSQGDTNDGTAGVGLSAAALEELVSIVIRVLEEILGDSHEDFVPLAKGVQEAIGKWADVPS